MRLLAAGFARAAKAEMPKAATSAAEQALHHAGLGIDAVAPDGLLDVVRTEVDGSGVPVAIEVSGNPAALRSALAVLAHEGLVLVAAALVPAAVGTLAGEWVHDRVAQETFRRSVGVLLVLSGMALLVH